MPTNGIKAKTNVNVTDTCSHCNHQSERQVAMDGIIIYLFRMAELNTVYIKIYTRFLFSEVLIHTIVQTCNIKRCKIVRYMM